MVVFLRVIVVGSLCLGRGFFSLMLQFSRGCGKDMMILLAYLDFEVNIDHVKLYRS